MIIKCTKKFNGEYTRARMSRLETELKEWFDEFDYNTLKRVGLAGCMRSYYLGLPPEAIAASPDEVASDLDLSNYEWSTWERIWYNRESWFNR